MRLRFLRQRVGQDSPFSLFLGPRLRLDPSELGDTEASLHTGQVSGQSLGNRAGVPGSVFRLAGQAVTGKPDQFGVGPAGVETLGGVGEIPPCGLALNLSPGSASECRPAG